MLAQEDSATGPMLVHYLPIATTLLSVAFLIALLRRRSIVGLPPHLLWWAIGIVTYGAGTALESAITLFGNSAELTRWWYVAGALLGGYPLGTGSVYLLCSRSVANRLTWISGTVVIGLAVAVVLSPIDHAALEPHRPTGDAIGWSQLRLGTPFINGYAALFLVGGALWSTFRFVRPLPGQVADGRRALGTAAIAIGGILPGVGGGMAKAGIVEALYVGEFVGLVLIWSGHALCSRRPVKCDASRPERAANDGLSVSVAE